MVAALLREPLPNKNMFDCCDIETESMKNVASALTYQHAAVWPQIWRGIKERCEMFRSGREHAPRWFNRKLRRIDPLLATRWDYLEQCWIVERFSKPDKAWVTVCVWKRDGEALPLNENLLLELQEGDTWRFRTPEEYLQWKHAKSAAVRERNRKTGDEKVLEAVDSLTRKRAEEFITVGSALKTGETVICHGPMERSFDAMLQGAKKAKESQSCT